MYSRISSFLVTIDMLRRPFQKQTHSTRFCSIQRETFSIFPFKYNPRQCQDASSHIILQISGKYHSEVIPFARGNKNKLLSSLLTSKSISKLFFSSKLFSRLLMKRNQYLPECVMIPYFQHQHVMKPILNKEVKCLVPYWVQAFIHNLRAQNYHVTRKLFYQDHS